MKTAQEWYVNLLGRPDMGWNVDMTQKEYHDHIREVQLDAMKEGMKRAAKLADHGDWGWVDFNCAKGIRDEINTKGDNLTLKDL